MTEPLEPTIPTAYSRETGGMRRRPGVKPPPPPPRTLGATGAGSVPLAQRPTKLVAPPKPDDHLHALISLPPHYEFKRKIAAGGMGAVILVYDKRIRRDVAVKVMLRPGDHDGYRLRFIEEAQVTGQLEHPNIVPIHEIGEDAIGRPYFTMKLIHGKSLGDIIKDAKQAVKGGREFRVPSLRDRLEIFLKVCDAISFAHQKGVIHRDLKPDNVMVGEFGEVQVMDWGIAKVLRSSPDEPMDLDDLADLEMVSSDRLEEGVFRTRDGAVAGTPAYMSPEQAKGEVKKLDERTDVYALGCVLYTMLTFHAPYKGKSGYEVLKKAAEGRFQKPSARIKTEGLYPALHVPAELDSILRMAMARQQNRRYRSVAELKADVGAFLENQSVAAHRDGFWGRAAKWTKRNPAKALGSALSVMFVLVLAAGAGVALAVIGEQGRENERLALAEAEAMAQAEREGRQRAEAEQERAVAERRAAEQAARTAEEARAREQAERERERLAIQAAVQERDLDALADQLGIELGYQRDPLVAQYMQVRRTAMEAGVTEGAFVRGLALSDRRRYIEAFEALMAASDEHGRRYETARDCELLGSLYLRGEEDATRALAMFERALTIDPAFVDGSVGKSYALIELDRFDEARAIADALIQQYPTDFFLWELKQYVEGSAGNIPGAIRALQQAYRLCPHEDRRAIYRNALERLGAAVPD